jgi:hypothetical protein
VKRVVGLMACVALCVGLVVVVLEASGDRGSRGGDGARLVVNDGGQALIGQRSVGPGEHRLVDGDTVSMQRGGAVVRLRGDVELELREGLGGARSSELRLGAVPTLLAGDLLVSAPGAAFGVEAKGAVVEVQGGAARLSSAFSLTGGLYGGQAVVQSAGRSVVVPSLRQAVVSDVGVISEPLALAVDGRDPWDRRHLGDAIDLGRVLTERATGFDAQLAEGEGRTPGFYTEIYPALSSERAFEAIGFDPERSPGEQLVGTAIALEGRHGSFSDRLDEVFSFRASGADWGLVALDQQVGRDALLDRIDEALNRSPLLFASPEAGTPTPPTQPPAPVPGPEPEATAPRPPAPAPTPEPPPSEPPPEEPPPPDDPPVLTVPEPLEPVADPVNDLLRGVLDVTDEVTDDEGLLPGL